LIFGASNCFNFRVISVASVCSSLFPTPGNNTASIAISFGICCSGAVSRSRLDLLAVLLRMQF
jgi:hypothetical protein